jgi:hypothetical protein
MLTALNALMARLNGHSWPNLDPASLNSQAATFGPSFNTVVNGTSTIPAQPAFTQFTPPDFLRPFVLPPGNRPHSGRRHHRRH